MAKYFSTCHIQEHNHIIITKKEKKMTKLFFKKKLSHTKILILYICHYLILILILIFVA